MHAELVGKIVAGVEVLQPKCLNVSAEAFAGALTGARLLAVTSRGKWIAYVHDILFLARLHPLRTAAGLTPAEVDALASVIRGGLRPSIDKGGAFYEMNLHGERGGFTMDDILIGYKEGKPCPACGTAIEKIKTGSIRSFICSRSQPYAA